MAKRSPPLIAAQSFADNVFPTATAVFVGGSVLRGEGTPTSDLDTVVITTEPPAPYRETFLHAGWTVEAFVHSARTLSIWADMDIAEGAPILARLVTEGEIVRDIDGTATVLQRRMQQRMDTGPGEPTGEELDALRYAITDTLDDLADSPHGLERQEFAAALIQLLSRLYLMTRGEWSGKGKWLIRRIAHVDPELSSQMTELTTTAINGAPTGLIELADEMLAPIGGRLLHGYRADGTAIMERWLRGAGDPRYH